jgi:hypothetical protein
LRRMSLGTVASMSAPRLSKPTARNIARTSSSFGPMCLRANESISIVGSRICIGRDYEARDALQLRTAAYGAADSPFRGKWLTPVIVSSGSTCGISLSSITTTRVLPMTMWSRIDTIFLATSHLDHKRRAFTGCCFKDIARHLQNGARKAHALQLG